MTTATVDSEPATIRNPPRMGEGEGAISTWADWAGTS